MVNKEEIKRIIDVTRKWDEALKAGSLDFTDKDLIKMLYKEFIVKSEKSMNLKK